ncbi:MAG: hypothetical protein H7Z17_02520 [Fuerstia sp.]|nr:hypothetical protein [Fuerstiella sp.]
MTTECSSTADAITGVLMAGDAVLNLSQQPLNTVAGTLHIAAHDDRLTFRDKPSSVHWQLGMSRSLLQLQSPTVDRIVVISDENCSDAAVVTRELDTHGIPHLHCTLMSACDSDAFMDEEDTEAVTERLRQLGYI